MGLRFKDFELVNFGAVYAGLATRSGESYKYKSFKMAELGSQNIKGPLKEKIGFTVSKDFFESVGVDHISFDMTGKQRSLPVDLGTELKDHWGQYDMVTNFYTSEHVRDEYNCFKNIHNLCKLNHLIVCAVPRKNSWPGHCYHYYDIAFFEKLSLACNYDILILREMKREDLPGGGSELMPIDYNNMPHLRANIQCLLVKKGDSDFISREQFDNLRNEN